MEFNFTSKVAIGIDYDSVEPKGLAYESRDSEAEVKYNVAIETRPWGIKSISFYGIKQEVSCYVELLDKETEETESFLFKIDLEDISTEGPSDFSEEACPNSLDITISEVEQLPDNTFKAKGKATLSF